VTSAERFTVEYAAEALKELRKLDQTVARRAVKAIDALGINPRPSGTRQLVGFTNLWRIRVGDYRIIYTIRDSELLVLALRVAHRREVYRSL
jgi:mRNA interferase RelE/StbE